VNVLPSGSWPDASIVGTRVDRPPVPDTVELLESEAGRIDSSRDSSQVHSPMLRHQLAHREHLAVACFCSASGGMFAAERAAASRGDFQDPLAAFDGEVRVDRDVTSSNAPCRECRVAGCRARVIPGEVLAKHIRRS